MLFKEVININTNIFLLEASDGHLVGMEVSGHNTNNVICAGISAITQSTLLGMINVLKLQMSWLKNDEKGYLYFRMLEYNEQGELLLNVAKNALEDIANTYGGIDLIMTGDDKNECD